MRTNFDQRVGEGEGGWVEGRRRLGRRVSRERGREGGRLGEIGKEGGWERKLVSK